MAVRKMALVTQLALIPIHIIYEPMLRALGVLGWELYSGGKLRTMG